MRFDISDKDLLIEDLRRKLDIARELVIALDGAFISSWQSTAAWAKQLEKAKAELMED